MIVSVLAKQVLDRLCEALPPVLAGLASGDEAEALSLRVTDSSSTGDAQRSFRVDGPGDVSFEGRLEAFPAGETSLDLHVEVEEGHSHRFTCHCRDGEVERDELERVSTAVASFLVNEAECRRIQSAQPPPALAEVPSHVPLLVLDEKGTIQDLTPGARHVLEHSPDEPIDPNVFSHVHGQNLPRVMRDLAHMVTHKKQRARWLLRLRTGNHRWRWCRVLAENHLDSSRPSVRMLLRPL